MVPTSHSLTEHLYSYQRKFCQYKADVNVFLCTAHSLKLLKKKNIEHCEPMNIGLVDLHCL